MIRAYLERCLDVINERESVVQAFSHLNIDAARAAADESTSRWRRGVNCPRSTACPLVSRTCLKRATCPPRWVVTPCAAIFQNVIMRVSALRGRRRDRQTTAGWAVVIRGQPPTFAARTRRIVFRFCRGCRCGHVASGDWHPGWRVRYSPGRHAETWQSSRARVGSIAASARPLP